MKKPLLKCIVFALILSSSLLLFGCNRNYKDVPNAKYGNGAVPSTELQGSVKYNVSELMEACTNEIDKALVLLTYTTYNMLNLSRYFMKSSSSGKASIYTSHSESCYVREGSDYYKQSLNHSNIEVLNSGERSIRYGTHRLVQPSNGIRYVKKTGAIQASWNSDLSDNKTTEIGVVEEIPEELYSRFEGNIDPTDSSLIQSANIEKMVASDGTEYYEVKLICYVNNLNQNSKILANLSANTSEICKDMAYTSYELTFDIWECGLYRAINYEEAWDGIVIVSLAKANGTFNRSLSFSYDVKDCCIAKYIEDCGFTKYLTEAEQARRLEEYQSVFAN